MTRYDGQVEPALARLEAEITALRRLFHADTQLPAGAALVRLLEAAFTRGAALASADPAWARALAREAGTRGRDLDLEGALPAEISRAGGLA